MWVCCLLTELKIVAYCYAAAQRFAALQEFVFHRHEIERVEVRLRQILAPKLQLQVFVGESGGSAELHIESLMQSV